MKKEIVTLRRIIKIAPVCTALIIFVSLTNAQTKPVGAPTPVYVNPTPATSTVPPAIPDQDYQMGPNDVIDIKIEDAPELSGTYRLNAKGTFTLPIIGLIEASKKTTEDLTNLIAGKLRGGYLANPIVSVAVKQRNTRTFYIQGAVHAPGMYQVEGRPTLLKLITIAGGLGDNFGSTAFIIREKHPGATTLADQGARIEKASDRVSEDPDDYEVLQANIYNLLRGSLEQNIVIQPGDIVHIPKTDMFFVAGEVKAPGAFPLKEGTTLRQAVSLAQGLNFNGAGGESVIFRENRGGARQELKVNITAVMTGKSQDIDIMPNDIIMVPNSQKKTVANTLLKSFGSTLPAVLLRSLGLF